MEYLLALINKEYRFKGYNLNKYEFGYQSKDNAVFITAKHIEDCIIQIDSEKRIIKSNKSGYVFLKRDYAKRTKSFKEQF